MNEYHVKRRPGLQAASRKESLLRSIDIMTAEVNRYPGASRLYERELADIERWKRDVEECDGIIASADPDEEFLQEIDYLQAAAAEFEKSRDAFIQRFDERISQVSDPEEAKRLVGLIPDEFSRERNLFLQSLASPAKHPDILAARERERQCRWPFLTSLSDEGTPAE